MTADAQELTAASPSRPSWLSRMGDRCNPILVKEVRQSLKSKQFVITFFFLVIAAWLTATFGVVMQGEAIQYEDVGRDFFVYFYWGLLVATIFIVPLSAFWSLQSEKDLKTFELLSVTTISPRQIVTGKLLSALTQALIFYSVLTPFIAFASTMQGFDAPQAAFILAVTLLASVMLSVAALMISSFISGRAAQFIFVGKIVSGLGFVVIGGGIVVTEAIYRNRFTRAFADREFWIAIGAMFVFSASYFVLFLQVATAQLTFESDNRSTAIRLTASGQFFLLWVVMGGIFYYVARPIRGEVFAALAIVSVVHWSVFGLVFTAEPDSLSRRIRRDVPRNLLLRLGTAAVYPGGARGYMFLLGHIVLIWALFLLGTGLFSSGGGDFLGVISDEVTNGSRDYNSVTAMCLYLVIYLGINTALARWLYSVSGSVRAAHVRVITFLLMMFAAITPMVLNVLKVLQAFRYGYHWIHLPNPFYTIDRLQSRLDMPTYILPILAVMAILAVLVNLPAMVKGLDLLSGGRPKRYE